MDLLLQTAQEISLSAIVDMFHEYFFSKTNLLLKIQSERYDPHFSVSILFNNIVETYISDNKARKKSYR